MRPHPPTLILPFFFFFQQTAAHFEPRAVDLSDPANPAAILPEHRNYGLFDRPALIPTNIEDAQQQDVAINRRADSMVSADPVPLTPTPTYAVSAITSAAPTMTAPATITGADGYGVPAGVATDLTYATDTDTHLLPSAYDSAQLSSLFAAESSYVQEASTLLSAFPTGESGVVCTGVQDVSGAEVTVCGPTGNPRATGVTKNVAVEGSGYVSWVCLGLGFVGGSVAFFL